MNALIIVLQVVGAWLYPANRRRDERGNVTTEHVLWAAAVIVLVGLVVAALTAFINTQIGKIA